MRTRHAPHATLLRLAAAFALAVSALAAGARAQSGRTPPPPTPTPTPTPQPTPKFVAAPGEERYRLVYAPGWAGPLRPGGDEADAVRHSRWNTFVARLNEAGERGYRLRSIVNGWQPVAVVELGDGQYEYGWFENAVVARSAGDLRLVYTRFFNLYKKQAAGGFRLAEHFVTERGCALFSTGFFRVDERCVFKDLYLLERPKGVERPRQVQLAVSFPDSRAARAGDDLTARVREGLSVGLRPAYVFSRFALLLEEAEGERDASHGASDFRVVPPAGGGGDLEKMVNELARQGYRMQSGNNGVALMRRAAGETAPAEYLWLDATEKSFAKRLAAAQESGAVYRMTYTDDEGDETRLVFERGLADGRRRDYRVFRLDFQFEENAAERKVSSFLSPQTLEALKEIEGLLREGYVFRDLFWADAPHLLFERAR